MGTELLLLDQINIQLMESVETVERTISLIPHKLSIYDVLGDIKSIICEINQELFGYAFVNIGNSQTFLEVIMSSCVDDSKLQIVKDALIKWANEVKDVIYMRELYVEDNKLKAGFLNDSTYYVLLPGNLGDTFLTCIWMKEFKKERGIKKLCAIVKKQQECIPTWFESIDEVKSSELLELVIKKWVHHNQVWELDNFIYAFPEATVDYRYYHFFEDIEYIHFDEYIKKIWLHAQQEWNYDIPGYNMTNKEKMVNTYHIDKKSVLLIPEASTSTKLPDAFWEKIIQLLTQKGYFVYINQKEPVQKENVQNVFETIENTVVIANQMDWIIGLRCGLCDIVSLTGTNMITIDTNTVYYEKYKLNEMLNKENIYCYRGWDEGNLEEAFSQISELV